MLAKLYRLTEPWEFKKVKERGQKVGSPLFALSFFKNNLDHSRFGFIATKVIGKAHDRHRAVRLLRESVRLNLEKIPKGRDFVLLARIPILKVKRQKVDNELLRLMEKISP